jgi:hypothetical protein
MGFRKELDKIGQGDKTEAAVQWFLKNQREMTFADFMDLIGGKLK